MEREENRDGGRETMIPSECPGVPRLMDTQREIIVSGMPARPPIPIIPFWGWERYDFMIL